MDDTSSIPLYILDALHNTKALANTRHEITWMELIEEYFRQGDIYVVDEIEIEGAEMLTTKYGQTEIAFPVTGYALTCTFWQIPHRRWPASPSPPLARVHSCR